MREALRGLTTRGRCFLAAGGAAGVSALLLGEKDLLRVALLLAAIPLVAALALTRTRYRVSCTRRVQPGRVPVGTPTQVSLRLENLSRVPTGMLLVEDQVPYTLGSRPRFVLDRLRPRQHATVAYTLRSDVRGRYRLGPLNVRLSDPFGLVELTRAFTTVDRLTVTPHVVALPPGRIGGEWASSGETLSRSAAVHGVDDAATREYRHGDDLRKVHWRSTARVGELMVRREEQPWQSRASVMLDTRLAAHRGEGPTSSLEWAVSTAASVGVHLIRSGYMLRLLTDNDVDLDLGSLGGEGVVLDQLAQVRGSRHARLSATAEGLRRAAGEGLLVAVLGTMDAHDAQMLASLRGAGATCVAVLIDSSSWLGLEPGRAERAEQHYKRTSQALLTGGWRVLEARHGMRIDTLWPMAGSRGAGTNFGQVRAGTVSSGARVPDTAPRGPNGGGPR